MKQSRGTSLLKSVVSTAVGFAISFAAQLIFLPLLGVPINLSQNTIFAIIMTVISVGRGYVMERIYEALRWSTKLSPFANAVLAERQRQIQVEGWDAHHDDTHPPGELACAGAAYARKAKLHLQPGYGPIAYRAYCPNEWPWSMEWWKPTGFRRDLVKGAALILAEGERFDRQRRRKG